MELTHLLPVLARLKRAGLPGFASSRVRGATALAPLVVPLSSRLRLLLIFTVFAGGSAGPSLASASSSFFLRPAAEVTSEGIFLRQIATNQSGLPNVRLQEAPAPGQTITLTRDQVTSAVARIAPELATTNWSGSARVTITRRTRVLGEAELKSLVTAQLQREHVRDRGELEVRFARAWTPVSVPDELLSVKISDLPTSGVSANFIIRFELSTPAEVVGTWQMPVHAKVWREIRVARSQLLRGQVLSDSDLLLERRDILPLRELLPDEIDEKLTLELTEIVAAGAPIYARSVRLRPLMKRGQIVDAILREGGLMVSLKVELLESGVFGQIVRVRNVQSRREFRGKIENEQTILVSL